MEKRKSFYCTVNKNKVNNCCMQDLLLGSGLGDTLCKTLGIAEY